MRPGGRRARWWDGLEEDDQALIEEAIHVARAHGSERERELDEYYLGALEEQGMTIIHCPSDTMAFYKDHPARTRVALVKKASPPKAKDLPSPPLPVTRPVAGRPARCRAAVSL